MGTVYAFFADGFEEIEAFTAVVHNCFFFLVVK